MAKEKITARLVIFYWRIYKGYIKVNNLEDDSSAIGAEEVIEFVRREIPENEWDEYFEASRYIFGKDFYV